MQKNGVTLKLVFSPFDSACWFPQSHIVESAYKVKAASKELYCDTGRKPNKEQVAEATGLSMKRIEAVLLAPKNPISLDQKTGLNQDLNPLVCIFPYSNKLSNSFHFCSNFSVVFCVTGRDFRSWRRITGRSFDQAVNVERPGKGTGHAQVEWEDRDPNEVWTGGWKNEDIARDWGGIGCE